MIKIRIYTTVFVYELNHPVFSTFNSADEGESATPKHSY